MIFRFPPTDKGYTFLQTNRSDDLGSLWSTLNLDFQSNIGVVRGAPRLKLNTSTADDADLGRAVGFAKFDGTIFTVAGSRVFKTDPLASLSNPGTNPFQEDASTNAQTDYSSDLSDILIFNNILFTTTTDAVMSLSAASGGTWTSRDTLDSGSEHMMCYFQKFERLYTLNSENTVRSMDDAYTVAVPGSDEFTLELLGDANINVITSIRANSQYIWLGILSPTLWKPSAAVYQWDGISQQISNAYPIPNALGVMALCVLNDVPYAMDSNAILYKFTGYNFEEVGRLPFTTTLPKNASARTNSRFIHPNGLMPTKNGTILAFINNENGDADATINENIPSGVWEWAPDIGFTHKYSVTYNPAESSTITDYGQNRLTAVGGITDQNWFSNSSEDPRNGTFLLGAQYSSDLTTTTMTTTLGSSVNWLDYGVIVNPSGSAYPVLATSERGTADDGTSLTKSITIPAGSNRGLLVIVGNYSATAPTGVTYNGSALTLLGTLTVGSKTLTAFYTAAPTVTTANIVATWAAYQPNLVLQAFSLTGVNQTTPFTNDGGAGGTSTSAANAFNNTTTYQTFINMTISDAATHTLDSAQTQVFNAVNTVDIVMESKNTATTGPAVTSVTVTKPTGLAVGDLLLAHIFGVGDPSTPEFATPAGWTSLTPKDSDGNARGVVMYIIATATEVAATNFSFSAVQQASSMTAEIFRFSGVNQTTPITASSSATGDTVTATYGTITPGVNNMLLLVVSNTAGTGITFSAYAIASDNPTWTEQYDGDGSNFIRGAVATALRAAATATGNGTISIVDTGSHQWRGYMIALNPAATGRDSSGIESALTTAYGIFFDDSNDTIQKKGYFVTTWFNSEEIQDKWTRLWAVYRRFLNSADSLVFKYRTTEEDPVYATIQWTSTTTFTTTTDITDYAPETGGLYGGEVEIIRGKGGSQCVHITNVSEAGGTYTVTVDTAVTGATSGTAQARFQKWIKILPEATGQIKQWEQMSIGAADTRIQIKCCMTFLGDDEFHKFAIFTNEDIKVSA